jgi:SAM-dependent methyltransferase
MLEIGRERAAELGLDNIEFRETDAEELDLPDEEFDAVLSRNGLMFFPDLPAALERMRSVLVEGGRLAAAVWGRPEQTPFIAVTHGTVARELGLPPPAPGTPGPLSLGDADALESRLREAGFADVHSERMTIDVDFASAEAYAKFVRAVSGPINNLLAGQSAERQEEVWSAVAGSASSYAVGDGSLSLPGEAICVVGVAP